MTRRPWGNTEVDVRLGVVGFKSEGLAVSRLRLLGAAVLDQGAAEFLADGPERHAIDDRSIAGFEAQAQMRLPNLVGINELV